MKLWDASNFRPMPGELRLILARSSSPPAKRLPSDVRPDIARLQKIVARYGNEILV